MDAVSHRNAEPLLDESPHERADVDNELPKPQSCYAAGLECRGCVRNSAANLARICLDLSVEAVRDSFFKVYPDHACLPMARNFVRAYRAARTVRVDSLEEHLDDFPLLAGSPL